MNLKGKSVIVTGASTGIGRSVAVALGRHGARVTVNYASSDDRAKETAALVEQAGGEAVLCKANVAVEPEARKIVDAAVNAFGKLDGLVNNAGHTAFVPFEDIDAVTEDMWRNIFGVNVVGTFYVTRAASKQMSAGGSIVNTASVAGHRPGGSSIPYCASKAALLMETKCMAKALGPNIRVNSVSPGYIADTAWNDSRPREAVEAAERGAIEASALKRLGGPEDMVGAVLFLLSEESAFCSGIDIIVDGGRSNYI